MPPTSWRESSSVIGQLASNPAQYRFLQAVRLLQQFNHANQNNTEKNAFEIAQFAPSSKEIIRFRTDHRLSFAPSEITALTRPGKKDQNHLNNQWQLTVAFLGLTGTSGVLPYHYSETLLQEIKNKNPSLLEFLELFNHRSVSLFYRASTKYKLPLQYEKGKLGLLKNSRDDFTQSLLSIVGLGTEQVAHRLLTDDEAILRYSGLLSQSVRTASGLRRMLQEHFGYPVSINEFQGQWQELLPDLRSRLTSKQYPRGCNVCLGNDAKLGSKGWFMQGKITVSIGPLSPKEFDTLAPGSRKLAALRELVRFYVGIEQDFEINITLKRSDLSKPLTLDKRNKPILGWNSWFANHRTDQTNEDTIKIRLSERSQYAA